MTATYEDKVLAEMPVNEQGKRLNFSAKKMEFFFHEKLPIDPDTLNEEYIIPPSNLVKNIKPINKEFKGGKAKVLCDYCSAYVMPYTLISTEMLPAEIKADKEFACGGCFSKWQRNGLIT